MEQHKSRLLGYLQWTFIAIMLYFSPVLTIFLVVLALILIRHERVKAFMRQIGEVCSYHLHKVLKWQAWVRLKFVRGAGMPKVSEHSTRFVPQQLKCAPQTLRRFSAVSIGAILMVGMGASADQNNRSTFERNAPQIIAAAVSNTNGAAAFTHETPTPTPTPFSTGNSGASATPTSNSVSYTLALELNPYLNRQSAMVTTYEESRHLLTYKADTHEFLYDEESNSVPLRGYYCYELDMDWLGIDSYRGVLKPTVKGIYIENGRKYWIKFDYFSEVASLEDYLNRAVVVLELDEGETSKLVHIDIPEYDDVVLQVDQKTPRSAEEIPAELYDDLNNWELYVQVQMEGERELRKYESANNMSHIVYNRFDEPISENIPDNMTFKVDLNDGWPILRQHILCSESTKWQ